MNTIARMTVGALASVLLGTSPAGAADEPGVKETIKRDAVEFGREVKKDATIVGSTVKEKSKEAAHAIAKESRAAGQSIKQGTKQAAHAVADGAHDAKQKITGSKSDTTK